LAFAVITCQIPQPNNIRLRDFMFFHLHMGV